MNNKSFFIVTTLLVIAGAVAIVSYLPTRRAAANEYQVANFPETVGEWEGKNLSIDERTYEILETRNLFIRNYKNKNGDNLYLYIVYSQDNRKVSHPPEICMTGGGLNILDKKTIELPGGIKAVQLLMEKGSYQQLVIYFFKAGNNYTPEYITQQMKVVVDRLTGKRTAGALIRLSIDIKDGEQEKAFQVLKSFAVELEPLLRKYLP